MLAPFAFPLRTGPPGGAQQWADDALVAGGTAWAVWSLRSLGRSVSVLTEARSLVDRGPYHWVRHPLYTGEIVSSLGLALLAGTLAALAVWLGFCFLQAYRSREQQLLVPAMPANRGYRARTEALFSGLFLPPPECHGAAERVIREVGEDRRHDLQRCPVATGR